MRHVLNSLFLISIALFLAACNPSKHLKDNEYLLTKNTVKVEDKKGIEFDDLIYTVRPITNKKLSK